MKPPEAFPVFRVSVMGIEPCARLGIPLFPLRIARGDPGMKRRKNRLALGPPEFHVLVNLLNGRPVERN